MFNADKISSDLIEQISHHLSRLMRHLLGEFAQVPLPDQIRQDSAPLLEQVRLLVRVANGDIPGDLADEDCLADVEEAIDSICQALFAAPGSPRRYTIPNSFWDTDLGQVIRQCQMWQRGDDLITFTEAAEIMWPDQDVQAARMRIKRMVERGELTGYTDPRASNPQHAARVSRLEVEEYSETR